MHTRQLWGEMEGKRVGFEQNDETVVFGEDGFGFLARAR